jgi:hypothetical protein
MASTQNPNLEILELAVQQLGGIADDLVFVGGCATGLLLTDPAAAPVRATVDVDAIAQVLSRAEYYQFAEKLKQRGFREDTDEGAPMCRWRGGNVILDVMPIDPDILGFGGDWYQEAQKNAVRFALPSGNVIFLITSPFFLLTKLDAFKGRGRGDYMQSHDIEDIVTVLDGRPELLDELEKTEPKVKRELALRFEALRQRSRFIDAVAGHLAPDAASQGRLPGIIRRIETISKLS